MASVNLTPVNRRALRRYGEFWRSLQLVAAALAQAELVAQKAADTQPARAAAGATAHWSAPTAQELRSSAKKAGQSLHVMATAAKKWEAELVSREWRR
ncbi:hypothetical protein [Pseudonocardia acidicola]|uniref:Uncharacterized protein n=1 Tax=Pseudonocardia acidicola TaxID=2724939 RepID=A0ABX1SJZ1_9PSEU|nr:hypothetical protein [Pseudonocardia acidicola]NMI00858.1 hypothetical protein [Pseudonocardia acidicola]